MFNIIRMNKFKVYKFIVNRKKKEKKKLHPRLTLGAELGAPQRAFSTLKHVYLVERSLYLYSTKKFLPYPMWDVTNTPHADTTSSQDYGVKRTNIPYGAKRNRPSY